LLEKQKKQKASFYYYKRFDLQNRQEDDLQGEIEILKFLVKKGTVEEYDMNDHLLNSIRVVYMKMIDEKGESWLYIKGIDGKDQIVNKKYFMRMGEKGCSVKFTAVEEKFKSFYETLFKTQKKMYFWQADDSAEEAETAEKSLKLLTVGVIRATNGSGENEKKKEIGYSEDAWEIKLNSGQDEVYLTNCKKCTNKIVKSQAGIQKTVLAVAQQNNSIQGKSVALKGKKLNQKKHKNTKIEEIEEIDKAVEEPVVLRQKQRNLNDKDSELDLFNNKNK
jgi:hypothetical protein